MDAQLIKHQKIIMDNKLQRSLSFADVFIYGLLYFMPMAPVAVFGIIYNMSSGMVALTYLLAAIAMIFSAISYSEMAKKIPLSGSVYSYVSQGINPFFGFVAGWAILLDYLLLPALLAILGAIALVPLFPEIPKIIWVFAFVLIPLLVNIFGINMNARISKFLLLGQIVVLMIFFAFACRGIITQHIPFQVLLVPFYNSQVFSWSLAFAAVPIAALSFIGFDAVSTLNEEAKGGGETVSKVTLLLLVIVTLLFILQVYLAAVLVPLGTVFSRAASETAFYTVSSKIVGDWFLPVITLTSAVLAILANALVSQATTAKVLFSMARDGRLPRVLSRLNKHHAPQRAIICVATLSLIIALIALHHVEQIVTMVTFGALTAYVMLNISVVVFFNKINQQHIFRHVISPACGIVILGYALFSANFHAQLLGGLWIFVGVVIAFILKRRNKLHQLTFDEFI